MEKESKVYFSLGSNLGDKEGNIHEAIRLSLIHISEPTRPY